MLFSLLAMLSGQECDSGFVWLEDVPVGCGGEHNCFYEAVDDNPYLNDFYDNMGRWSFNLQIFFLYKRFSNQIRLLKKNKGFIQDRSIYEDKEIFARNLKDLNFMSTRDWLTYQNLFNEMINFIKEPDLIIYLKASTVTLISRIKKIKLN